MIKRREKKSKPESRREWKTYGRKKINGEEKKLEGKERKIERKEDRKIERKKKGD